jgi:1-phosphofructokinase family hexose kinase
VVIAGPNLTTDRTGRLAELRPGDVVRFDEATVMAGGKGVNVARVALALGAPAVLVGLLPGHTGAAAAAMLADEGIELRGVAVGGELRAATVVLERSGRVTVLNEPGPPLADGDWERYEAAVGAALDGARVLACSGSLPPGAPPDAYARLVARGREHGALVLVDAAGGQLAAALAVAPDVVTPNLAEAEGLLHGRADEAVEAGEPADARARAEQAARELVARGARHAAVTAGAAGVALAGAGGPAWVPAPAVAVRNPIGAGDSLVGGLGVALERGRPLAEAVRFGVACAAASVETHTAGAIDPARARALEAQARA